MSVPKRPDAKPGSSMTPKGVRTLLIALGALVGLVVLAAALNTDNDPAPTTPAFTTGVTSPAVDYEVVRCDIESDTFAKAIVELTVDRPLSYVGLGGDFTTGGGQSIGQGIGNLSNVTPGRTYRTTVIYSLSGSSAGGTCHVSVDSVIQ